MKILDSIYAQILILALILVIPLFFANIGASNKTGVENTKTSPPKVIHPDSSDKKFKP